MARAPGGGVRGSRAGVGIGSGKVKRLTGDIIRRPRRELSIVKLGASWVPPGLRGASWVMRRKDGKPDRSRDGDKFLRLSSCKLSKKTAFAMAFSPSFFSGLFSSVKRSRYRILAYRNVDNRPLLAKIIHCPAKSHETPFSFYKNSSLYLIN